MAFTSKVLAMRTLSLMTRGSGNEANDLPLDHDGNITASSLVGTVLAGRYRILERIHADSFKAYDLTLDQIVTARPALLTAQPDGDTWRQKVQQLALVRDPNFLNVLDVISGQSGDFVITEPSRGHSISDLLQERSCFDLGDVLRLMTPLGGALDRAASFSCCSNPISTSWFFTETRSSFAVDPEQRSLSNWPAFFVKLDVWELVKPRKNNTRPFLTSKKQRGGSRGLAVRQAALLTYELLGGEKIKEGQVKHWFKPVNQLSHAANRILYVGLQGSPRFESSESFLHKLAAAIQSGQGGPRAWYAPASPAGEHFVALPDTSDVIRRFNSDTKRLAMFVVGAVVSAALMLAVVVQDRHPLSVDLKEEAVPARGDLMPSDNSATLFKDAGLNGKKSTGEITTGQARRTEQAFTENPYSQRGAAAFTPVPFLAFPAQTDQINAPANPDSSAPAHWQDSAQAIRPKIRSVRNRSSTLPRTVDVKMRLIALWHQSLARAEKSRSWTTFSNLNRGTRKKAAYTAEMNH
jgi:hypothetical protein